MPEDDASEAPRGASAGMSSTIAPVKSVIDSGLTPDEPGPPGISVEPMVMGT